ncbi:MAG: tRNA (adenosine(37)-N6)-dimethylallyltransferase MiaA [Actinobacteria bacterium]|uniref:tRNA dimethylallyltransferase n=1 Tax=freshwater metagenome TaxID=449393 RepID=A0A6J6E9U6_9ZZZZ|nr:tRNA (adenosine(37)-N6)-dimethylallyltransferase MiaA [Actinomycetota bacterium]
MNVIVICGATATGKSDLAVALAREIDGEVINADSMQLYKGMDIGTAKITLEEQQGVPHHLMDQLDVTEDANVAWYQEKAREKITEVHSRKKNAIIVGGTGLYIKAILDDLNFPDTDPVVRTELELEYATKGIGPLFERLEKLDPAAALAIDKANSRRVIRALEVIKITGKPFTANLPRKESTSYPEALQFGLVMDRELLGEKISARVERMWQAGFVAEVESLIEAGITRGTTAQKALGYSQVIAYKEGKISEEEAIEETKRATRQYARRQETWFSRDERIMWISPIQNRIERILNSLNSST